MVSPPRRATHAAAAEAGPACARPTPAHEAPAAQPAYWLAQRAAPACLAPRPRTAPRTPSAVGQRLLDARCMLLLLPPPRGPSAYGECPHELLIVSGLSPSTKRNQAFGPPQGYALLTARCEPHCHCRVCHPLTAYSPEIALRLAYIRKIHLYFSTHRSLSARCDLSRVSCIPPRACAATSHVYRSQRSPWTACSSSMTTCMPLRPRMST